jgi:hypothetical protein
MEIKDLKSKGYEPSEAELKWFNAQLLKEFGTNPHGEAKFRVVNGRTATWFSLGNPNAIKYVNLLDPTDNENGMPFPMLEEWMSPERLGSEEDWERYRWWYGESFDELGKLDVLGEYPRKGMYVLCGGRPLMNADCEPLPLTEEVLRQVIGMIKSKPKSAAMLASEIRAMQDKAALAREKKRQLAKEKSKAIWDSLMGRKEKINAGATRDYSFGNFSKKGGLYLPNN